MGFRAIINPPDWDGTTVRPLVDVVNRRLKCSISPSVAIHPLNASYKNATAAKPHPKGDELYPGQPR